MKATTPKQEAIKLIKSFSKVNNMVYTVAKDQIILNLIIQNATIHCKVIIKDHKGNADKVQFHKEVIKELKKLRITK